MRKNVLLKRFDSYSENKDCGTWTTSNHVFAKLPQRLVLGYLTYGNDVVEETHRVSIDESSRLETITNNERWHPVIENFI